VIQEPMPDMTSNPLFVLVLEDQPADFDLVVHELRRSGFAARCQRVETEADYLIQLQEGPDIILADYALSGFDALGALRLLQESGLIIPVIVLTGAVSEDTVVECMRRGAADYLIKDRIKRLGPAVQRALEEADLRRQKQRAERALRQINVELEEQYHKAEAANRMKSVFLANMSHELRTPLTAIIGFAELIVDGKVGPVALEQLDLLQEVLGNGRHLLGLINDVLDLAKIESGTMSFRPEPISISETVGETISGLRTLAAQKRIGLTADVRTPAEKVFLDSQRLKQVLLNYVSNALKFTPPGGRITARVLREGNSFFRLEVEDTGIGIARADIGRLFQDFHQLDDGLSKQVQGTGLGLALTKRIVEAQGGHVGVASTVGKGSTFFAVLPYALAEAEQDAAVLSALQ
jgi:signal transduction histidine kinase